MDEKIKILLVDDHEEARNAFKELLNNSPRLNVIATASSADELLVLLESIKPDIIIMDVKMPKINGIEATKLIKVKYPNHRVIMLSMYVEEEYVWGSINAGASGYLFKDSTLEEIEKAVEVVHSGGYLIHPLWQRNL